MTSSSELQEQMREVRQSLGHNSEEIVREAREQLDWRNFVAKHPWLTLAAAAAAGFLLVPRRHRCASLDADAVGRSFGKTMRDIHHELQSAAGPAPAGLVRGLFISLGTILVQEGLAIGSEFVREFMRKRSAGGRPPQHKAE